MRHYHAMFQCKLLKRSKLMQIKIDLLFATILILHYVGVFFTKFGSLLQNLGVFYKM